MGLRDQCSDGTASWVAQLITLWLLEAQKSQLMPTLFPARHPFPKVFNGCNKKELDRYLQSGGGMCLSNMPDTRTLYGGRRCGNGYLEDGEECDCGDEEVSATVVLVRGRFVLTSKV